MGMVAGLRAQTPPGTPTGLSPFSYPIDYNLEVGEPLQFYSDISTTGPITWELQTASGIFSPTDDETAFSGTVAYGYVKWTNLPAMKSGYILYAINQWGRTVEMQGTITVTDDPPRIAKQPANVEVNPGQFVEFSFVPVGSYPQTWQWLKDGAPIPGATGVVLQFQSAQASDAGTYSAVVTNHLGTVTTTRAVLKIDLPTTPLTITQAPASQTVVAGTAVSFSVGVSGTAPVSYQWQKDGKALAGATDATLALSNPQATDAGAYVVVATNAAGSVTSAPATLSVTVPVKILGQPQSQTVLLGQSPVLQVSVDGSAPLSYQWRKDGTPLAGATGATLTVTDARAADAGNYSVSVTNSAGTVTSAVASLAVNMPGRLINLSILTTFSAAGETFTMATVTGGAGTTGTKALLARAAGPSLKAFGVGNPLADPRLDFFSGSTAAGQNDNWGGTAAITAANTQVGAFAFSAPDSKDAALLLPAATAGASSVQVSATDRGTGTVLAEIYDATPGNALTSETPRLINVSVLKPLGSGVTAGFVIAGSSPLTVLIRVSGPALAAFGVGDFAADPKLELFDGAGASLATNDNWGGASDLAATFAKVGAFAWSANSRDAALAMKLNPGAYSVRASDATASSGQVLIEVYEVP